MKLHLTIQIKEHAPSSVYMLRVCCSYPLNSELDFCKKTVELGTVDTSRPGKQDYKNSLSDFIPLANE